MAGGRFKLYSKLKKYTHKDLTQDLESIFKDLDKKKRYHLLRQFLRLAHQIHKRKISYPDFVFLSLFKIIKTPGESEESLSTLLNFIIRLDYPWWEKLIKGTINRVLRYQVLEYRGIKSLKRVLEVDIPGLAERVRNQNEFILSLRLGTRLIKRRIDPGKIFRNVIPSLIKITHEFWELEEILGQLERLVLRVRRAKIVSLSYFINSLTELTKKLRKSSEFRLSVELGERLLKKRIDPSPTFRYSIPTIIKLTEDLAEFRQFLAIIEDLVRKIKEKEEGEGTGIYDTQEFAIPILAEKTRNKAEFKLAIQFGIVLSEKNIYPAYTLQYGLPAVTKVTQTMEEFELIIGLGVKLAEKGIDPGGVFLYAIPAVADIVRSREEFKLAIEFGTKFTELGVNPSSILQYGIPPLASVIRLREEFVLSLELGTILVEKGLDQGSILNRIVPELIKTTNSPEELIQTLKFGIRLAENKINPKSCFIYTIPVISKLSRNFGDFKESLDTLENLVIGLKIKELEPLDGVMAAVSILLQFDTSPVRLKESLQRFTNLMLEQQEKREVINV